MHAKIRLRWVAAALTLVLAGGVAIAAPAAAETGAETNAAVVCTLRADPPTKQGRFVEGEGGGSCSSTVTFHVLLRHDRSWRFDTTLDEKRVTGRHARVDVSYDCGIPTLFDSKKVFVETRTSSGEKRQSPRRVFLCR